MRVQCPPVTALSRQEVWQHLPGCAAHLRLWGRSHEAAGWDNNFDPYPLVNIQKAIENGHLYWVFPLKMVIYHSYANVYQRVYWTMSLWNILVYHSTWSSYRFPFKSAIFWWIFPSLASGCCLPRAHRLITASRPSTPIWSSSSRREGSHCCVHHGCFWMEHVVIICWNTCTVYIYICVCVYVYIYI